MLGMMNNWIYDKNPVEGVLFEAPLKALKEDLASGVPVFQNLIKKYFVNNQHRVTVEMKPDLELEEKQRLEEESRLARAKESMSEQQVKQLNPPLQVTHTLCGNATLKVTGN
jgi:Zn-dependent M16 (insulinase) family peptidase